MIEKSLISLIYETASIQRWNDHIRPYTGFTELDKQAHKMFYAYVLAKCEGMDVDMIKLIEGGIFEFFHRSVLTDIKPPIYHKLMKEKGDEINEWVFSELRPMMEGLGGGFFGRMHEYFFDPDYAALEKQILRAAHYCASDWEFRVIYPLNKETYGIEQVKAEMAQGLAACDTFRGFRYFRSDENLSKFLSLLGKLRYQQRWAKAVRMPPTFVMGHMLVVGIIAYFVTLELDDPCSRRRVNNFNGGLFHDLPEALTRDIVSPVKASVEGLGHIISGIEREQVQDVIYPLLPKPWHREIRYYTTEEFTSHITENGKVKKVTSDLINEKYNDDAYDPIDGEIIRACDHLSAYIEASLSLSYGIMSAQMLGGYENLQKMYNKKIIGGFDFSKLFAYFDLE